MRQLKKRIYKCDDHEKNGDERTCYRPKERSVDERRTAVELRHIGVNPLLSRLGAFMKPNNATPVDDPVEACHQNRYEAGNCAQDECWRNRVTDDLGKLRD